MCCHFSLYSSIKHPIFDVALFSQTIKSDNLKHSFVLRYLKCLTKNYLKKHNDKISK